MGERLRFHRIWPSVAGLILATACTAAPAPISSLTDEEFQRLSLQLSEAPGYFDTDNLISNETSYQHVVPRLLELDARDAAYLGVGPDQNFTYIAALRPRIALIIDIRRDNLVQHLFFKQLFAMAETPLEYLSSLLGKEAPQGWTQERADSDFPGFLDALRETPPDRALFEETFDRLWTALRTSFPLLIQPADQQTLRRMARAFHEEGLELRFTSHGRPPRPFYPTLRRLLLETDLEGGRHNYLTSNRLYQIVRAMQRENRIVPVVGDLGSEKAVSGIARFLRERDCPVAAFYTSNVEFYLFSNRTFERYAAQVGQLPLAPGALFVRSYFNYWREPHPDAPPTYPMASLVQPMRAFVETAAKAPFRDYHQLVRQDSLPLEIH